MSSEPSNFLGRFVDEVTSTLHFAGTQSPRGEEDVLSPLAPDADGKMAGDGWLGKGATRRSLSRARR